jgi:hypothetical protein
MKPMIVSPSKAPIQVRLCRFIAAPTADPITAVPEGSSELGW